DKDFYISHIQGDQYIFKMKKVLDNVAMVLNNHRLESTDFLDPYEIFLSKSILNRFDDIAYQEDGGVYESERKVISIYPYYFENDDIKEKISFLRIDHPSSNLTHKDFLGAILNMGITRDKLGDLYVHKKYAFVIVKNEIKDYLLYYLAKVSNYNVKVQEIHRDALEMKKDKYEEINKYISSLRLDIII